MGGGGGGLGGITTGIGTGLGAIVTGGTSLIPGSPTQKLGQNIGNALTLGTARLGQNSNGGFSAPVLQGKQDPLSMLTMSGGAPLLADIAMGADINTSIMGFLGATGDFNNWRSNLDPQDADAILKLQGQLQEIKANTDTQNQAVNQLVKDYPNIMTQKIQQYQNVADPTIQKMMGQAMQQLSAQQAAGGALSSGAAIQAASNTGAQYAGQELQYATGLASQDYAQQLNAALGAQSFQQKMLGQGAQNGFNAVQNALQRNTGLQQQNSSQQFQAGMYNQQYQNQQNDAMWGAVGQVGGTALGGMFGGPAGAAIGGQVGGSLMRSPRLNIGGRGFGGQSMYQNYGGGSPS